MRILALATASIAAMLMIPGDTTTDERAEAVSSDVVKTRDGDVFLIQEVLIDAPVDKVWKAYTTTEGWQAWIAPVARVNVKMGGTIKANYRPGGSVDDPNATALRVVNFVPQRLLTLQAKIPRSWPAALRDREHLMYNVITFERVNDTKTRLISYGIGYQDKPELMNVLKYFTAANEKHYRQLIAYVEDGVRAYPQD